MTYLAEGNKNVCFLYQNNVLRLGKQKEFISLDEFHKAIEPIINQFIPSSYFAKYTKFHCSPELLLDLERVRPKTKRLYLPIHNPGYLVKDYSNCFELKPKWLTFYPKTETCRNCRHNSRFCPMDLLDQDLERVSLKLNCSKLMLERVQSFFLKLRDLQLSLDEFGIEYIYSIYNPSWTEPTPEEWKNCTLNSDPKSIVCRYALAMTFRDCSVMINDDPVILDYDPKSIHKVPEWFKKDALFK